MTVSGAELYSFSPHCSLKLLEEPAVYNRATDELYFVNQEALDFLVQATGGMELPATADRDFVDFCLDEEIIVVGPPEKPRSFEPQQSPIPSLRYLLLHITERCNLRCRHCYAGEAGDHSLPVWQVLSAAEELEALQGLRLMLSGGEPLLHPDFWEINDCLDQLDLRVILMTNGTLVDETIARRLKVQEVQVSLDGMADSHDLIRGRGSYDKTLGSVKLLKAAGLDVSIATMVHAGNLGEFGELAALVGELGVREWSIDQPSVAGRMSDSRELLVDPELAAPLLDLSFGGAIHEPFPGFACGSHLMAVTAAGGMARCGFYANEPVGNLSGEGLEAGWEKIHKIPLAELDCDCEFLAECRGGCRFRASGYNKPTSPDPCQCYRYGVIGNQDST